MISKVVMPNLGATGTDIVLDDWLVQAGDYVRSGDPIFVVTTDKATVEVEAFRSGYIRQQLVSAGESVPPGAELAILADTPDEPLDEFPTPGDRALDTKDSGGEGADEENPDKSDMPERRILVTPIARRMAKEAGIDLRSIKGSGRQGEILKRDVQSALKSRQPEEKGTIDPADPPFRREPLSPMRRAVAERTHRSKSEIPHFYTSITVDMSAAIALLKNNMGQATKRGWPVPTINDLLIRAVSLSLKETPQLNASFQDDEIRYFEPVNIGFVIGLSEGMLVPVIHHADRKNLFQLAGETSRLIEKAKVGTLGMNDLAGGTFTISNLGMYGLDQFTAVINPPQAGTLAIGAVRELPANWEGQIQLRSLMTATLSTDHRVVDGITAAKFMQTFKELLEDPFILFLPDIQAEGK
jgi:pyruvate dehydrogenase E2 component (dihydrolipoamide acetyltransferase)